MDNNKESMFNTIGMIVFIIGSIGFFLPFINIGVFNLSGFDLLKITLNTSDTDVIRQCYLNL